MKVQLSLAPYKTALIIQEISHRNFHHNYELKKEASPTNFHLYCEPPLIYPINNGLLFIKYLGRKFSLAF